MWNFSTYVVDIKDSWQENLKMLSQKTEINDRFSILFYSEENNINTTS